MMKQFTTRMASNPQASALVILALLLLDTTAGYAVLDIRQDEKAKLLHRLDTLNILAYVCILILIVCTIWLFKHKRVKFIHETGLAVIYGLIVGAIIRYAGKDTDISQMSVVPRNQTFVNSTIKYGPPDMLWIEFNVPAGVREDVDGRFIHPSPNTTLPAPVVKISDTGETRSYAYVFQGEIYNPKIDGSRPQNTKILEKATFDPEIFFNLILPLIVFNAGYSLKRKFFFRNFGAIMTYAFFGTTISCFVVAMVMKTLVWMMPSTLSEFSFTDCLYFGAIISATDPVTVLAIFGDLHVDVTLHALVFGESIFNDVICIVLASSIDSFSQHYSFGFFIAMYRAFGNFLYIFACSFLQGSLIGCATALLTKFTKLCDHPLLESTLFVLCSYASFLLSEAFELSGIVSVLFCGICQAHYTYNNLSPESRIRTKSLFQMCNFIAENFIFAYIGVSIFTFPQHLWSFWFILWTFVAIILGRALNIYPLSYFLNLGRHNKIPKEFQHVLFVSGLRGAMAFALAIRNTLTEPRRLMLTSTSIVSISSVIVCGSSIQPILQYFLIATDVDEAIDHNSSGFGASNDPNTSFNRFRNRAGSSDQVISPADDLTIGTSPEPVGSNANLTGSAKNVYEKAWLVRKWYNFDINLMKPLLTHAHPTLIETMPTCCLPIARFLTSAQQMEAMVSASDRQPFRQRDDANSELSMINQSYATGRQKMTSKDRFVGSGEGINGGGGEFNSRHRYGVDEHDDLVDDYDTEHYRTHITNDDADYKDAYAFNTRRRSNEAMRNGQLGSSNLVILSPPPRLSPPRRPLVPGSSANSSPSANHETTACTSAATSTEEPIAFNNSTDKSSTIGNGNDCTTIGALNLNSIAQQQHQQQQQLPQQPPHFISFSRSSSPHPQPQQPHNQQQPTPSSNTLLLNPEQLLHQFDR